MSFLSKFDHHVAIVCRPELIAVLFCSAILYWMYGHAGNVKEGVLGS